MKNKRKRSQAKREDRERSQSLATAYKKGRVSPLLLKSRPNSTKVGAGTQEIVRGDYQNLHHKKNHGRSGKKAQVVNVNLEKL